MKKLHYIVVFLLIVGFACKKKEYPKTVQQAESPFYLKLLVNGQPLDITAGANDYYMFSSIGYDTASVYSLIGEFKQSNCTNCTNSIKLEVYDSKKSPATSIIDVNSVVQVKNYEFLRSDSDSKFSKAIIVFTDANGIQYSSKNTSQTSNAQFQVVAIEDFVSDLNNKPIKKVKLKFNCTLYNGSKSISLEGTEVVVGLSN